MVSSRMAVVLLNPLLTVAELDVMYCLCSTANFVSLSLPLLYGKSYRALEFVCGFFCAAELH